MIRTKQVVNILYKILIERKKDGQGLGDTQHSRMRTEQRPLTNNFR